MAVGSLPRAPTFGPGDEAFEDDGDVEIDWVLVYDCTEIDLSAALEEYRTLIRDIEDRGLQVQVRHGYGTTLLVLIRIPRALLGNEVYRSRVKDWLHGIIHTRPVGDSSTIIEADTPAEALRSVFHLVTWTKEQGGAGITAGVGQWERVTASFPPQTTASNSRLLRSFAAKTVLWPSDLDEIRALFGEKVAFYYAFIQSYSIFLLLPSVFGIFSYFAFESYNATFAVLMGLWSVVFVEYWRRQETDLSLRWDVKGVAELKVNRPQYVWEEEYKDPTTGQVHRRFPAYKRLMRQVLFLPFAVVAGIALGTVLVITFALEAMMNDFHTGESQRPWMFNFLPTITLSLCLPYVTSFLEDIATKLSDFENHQTADEYELAQVQKSFVLNFVTSFLPIILTAYIYVPYGAELMSSLLQTVAPMIGLFGSVATGNGVQSNMISHIDASRLQDEVIGLSMTAQVMSFCEEIVIPYLQRRYKRLYRRWRNRHHRNSFEKSQKESDASTVTTPFVDAPQERSLLTRLRFEAEADTYDVQEDIMEMVVQFGYLTLFSCSWPLMPLGFLVNNWVELRGDFWKLARESQRPPPIRGQGIGASLGALEFLTWIGTLSSAALVSMYSSVDVHGQLQRVHLGDVVLAIFVAEQLYLLSRIVVAAVFEKIGSEAVREEAKRRYLVRKRYLETFSEEASGAGKRHRSKTYASESRSSPSGRLTPGSALSPVPEDSAVSDSFFRPASAHSHHRLPSSTEPFPALDPQNATTPGITLSGQDDEAAEEAAQYGTAAAERFWTELEDANVDATEAGQRLIVTLKNLQSKNKGQPEEDEKKSWLPGRGVAAAGSASEDKKD